MTHSHVHVKYKHVRSIPSSSQSIFVELDENSAEQIKFLGTSRLINRKGQGFILCYLKETTEQYANTI